MSHAVRRSAILGAWELSSYVVLDETGAIVALPFGEDAVGLLLYTEDGFVSAQLMRRGRPAFDDVATAGGSVEQTVTAARGYLAYSGPFDLDEATATLYHHVDVALLPNWIGGQQVRDGVLHDGLLVLSGDVAAEFGGGARAVLTWHRPKAGVR
jgi:hypothetical protein